MRSNFTSAEGTSQTSEETVLWSTCQFIIETLSSADKKVWESLLSQKSNDFVF